jgi:hypothetical protein
MGTGVTSGNATIANTDMFTSLGAAYNANQTFKAGWGGSIGPIFSMYGTFPNTAGTPSSSTIQSIASGATNLLTSPPSGMTVKAYYKMNDVGTWADSTGNYANLTLGSGSTLTAGSPAIAPSQITITERQSGMVFSIDHSTITPNTAGAVCYSGSPATGTGYFTGTWAQNTQGQSPNYIIVSVLNSSGTAIAQTSVSPNVGGTWSASVSGIPWGGPYTVEAQWSNSASTLYHSENNFYIGISLLNESQSEWERGISEGTVGDDVGSDGETVSILQPAPMGTSGTTNISDDYNAYSTMAFLDGNNWPGQNTPKYYKYVYTSGAPNQIAAYAKDISGWSGCPLMVVPVGRSGHSRETTALDRQVFPNANASSNGLTSTQNWVNTAGNTYAVDLAVTAFDNTQRPFVLPGSISIAIPHTAGTVTATDNGAGIISASDGTTGITNYGFNSMTTDSSALFTDLHLTTSNTNYFDNIDCEINSSNSSGINAPCQSTTAGLIKGTTGGLSNTTTLAGSGTVHFCLDQPNVPAALTTFCPSGYKISLVLGTNTVGDLINAINSSPYAPLVQASLVSGVFTLTPVGPYTLSFTAGSAPSGTPSAIWTTDLETQNGSGYPRGAYAGTGGTATPTQIPDGWGDDGDMVNCQSGWVSLSLCQVRAPFTAGLEVIGAADENESSSTMKLIEQAVFAKFATAQNANASMPWAIVLAHRTAGLPYAGSFVQFTNYRSMTLGVATQGTVAGVPYYDAGNCGLYQVVNNSGPHPDASVGGGTMWGQCVGEGMRDAVLGNSGNTWSVGPSVSSAVFDTTYSGCSTPGQCIKVTFTLPSHATSITTAGGVTAASSTGPTGCTAGTTYTDGEVNFICLSAGSPDAFSARTNSTSYNAGDLFSAVPASDPYALGNIYQVATGGITSSSNPYTLSNEFSFNAQLGDGTATVNFMGYNMPYATGTPLYPGMLVTNGGNVYEVTGASPTTPTPQGNCQGFDVGPVGSELESSGYNPRTLATTTTTFTCRIIDATHVELINNTSSWTSGTTGILYGAGADANTLSGWNTPTDEETLAGYIDGNRGFVPLVTVGGPTLNPSPGMPALPLLSDLNVGTHA